MSETSANRYWAPVDATAENNAHAYALELLGYNKRVLELGPAAGHVTRVLAARGCEVVGIEVDAEAAVGLEGVVADCFVGDLNDPSIIAKAAEERGFDAVLAGDVLEHLTDPLVTLKACRDVLVPGGYVVISLPNVAHADIALSLHLGRFDYNDYGLLDRTHLRFFTLQTIQTVLDQAGLVAIDVRRVIRPVFETELGLDPSDFDADIVESVLAHPEAETYQFVVRALPHNGDLELSHLAQRAVESYEQARRERIGRLASESELARIRVEAREAREARAAAESELARIRVEAREARADAERLYREAFDNARHVEALLATKTMRVLAPLRAVYRSVRGSR